MTRVRFYTNVIEQPAMLNHLLQQAINQKHQATVFVGSQTQAKSLSDYLWQSSTTAFVPHALADEPHAKQSPVVLAWQAEQIHQDDILLNCQPSQALFFSRFQHLFEVVGIDETEKIAGRERYKFYRDRGYDIKHIDMQEKTL